MAEQQSVLRARGWSRLAAAGLAGALVVAIAGCGSRASDEEIATALRGQAVAQPSLADTAAGGPAAVTAPGAIPATEVPGSGPAAVVPGETGSGGQTTRSNGGEAKGDTSSPPAGADSGGQVDKAAANKSVVKIGVVGAFSGVFGAVYGAAPKAVSMWATAQNALGGVNGHPIKVIVGDDQADPSTSLTLIKRMVENDRVIGFVGNLTVFGFEQIEKYLRAKNVPVIGGDGILALNYTSPISFPVYGQVSATIVTGLKSLVREGTKKIGLAFCLEAAAICQYIADEVKKSEVGSYISDSYQVSLVAPSYTAQCLRMKQNQVDTIMLLLDTAGAARFVQNCATQGFNPRVMLLGLDATKEMPTIPALSKALIPGATVPPVELGLPALTRYLKVTATYGAGLGHSGLASYGWVSAEMFGLVGRTLSDNPTPAELIASLWKVRNETLGGQTVPITYVKGKGAQVKPCIFIWAVANGKFTAPNGSKMTC